MAAIKAARAAPIGASLMLLAAQMLGLAQGHDFFQRHQGMPGAGAH